MLILGRAWTGQNVKKALDGITTSEGSDARVRRHYPFEGVDRPELLAPWMWIEDVKVAANGGNAVFPVRTSSPVNEDVSVGWDTSDGSARSGKEYGGSRVGVVTLKKGSSRQTISIPLLDDVKDEFDKTFQIVLAVFPRGVVYSRRVGTCTVVDNDPAPSLMIQDTSVAKHLKTMTTTVKLSAASDKQVSVKYATATGTGTYKAEAGRDFAATTGTLTWEPGDPLTKTFTIPILDDPRDEYDKTYQVQLSTPPNAAVSRGAAICRVLDND